MATVATNAPPAPQQPQQAPSTVTVPQAVWTELQAAQTRLAQLEEEKRDSDARALIAEGRADVAVKQAHERWSAAEGRMRKSVLENELAQALADQPFVSASAKEQFTRLIKSELQVDAVGDTYSVRGPAFENPREYVASQLARPEYSHFMAAAAPAPGAQAMPGQQAPGAPPAEPRNFSEALMMKFGANPIMGVRRAPASAPAAIDLRQPFGLRPSR
jgi:hypothetical protein